MKVAILGANGFIGHRLFEVWQTRGPHLPRAVVRAPASLARVARFDGDWRLADARDAAALVRAFNECEAVIHCAVGDERTIKTTIDPVVQAARVAGVRKLVYLSSAAVHGQCPPRGTDEESALHADHPLSYNNAKIWAEERLRSLARCGPIEIALLRPGIVFGPRSRWITDLADALVNRTAHWIEGGCGICNSIYVDNLVHAIERALATDGLRAEPFLIGDAEEVTWRDFQLGMARGLGYDESAFVEAIPTPVRPRTWVERLDNIRSSRLSQRIITRVPSAPKRAIKAALAAWARPTEPNPWMLPNVEQPVATLEMSLLYACRTKLPNTKAVARLGYHPPVSFAEGMRRSTAWLRAAEHSALED
jgi:2-alkyl-3-oxoalkanoate reductase